MTIQVFAVLKDYFDREFFIPQEIETVAVLKQYLVQKNTEAAGVLDLCRFAVDDEFVEYDYLLKKNDVISIIPPSSGG